MDAGLVDYKLCDKNFDCESCPFDVIMKKQYHPFAERAVMQSEKAVSDFSQMNIIERLTEQIRNADFPDDRLYFSNHTWMKKMEGEEFQIGIDAFLATLLHPINSAIFVNPSSRIANDSPCAWVIHDNQTFTLHNPLPGTVRTINAALTSKPGMMSTDCYEQGWVLTITAQENALNVPRCYTSDEFRSLVDTDLHRIESIMHQSLKRHYSLVGSTMYDGGARVDTIEQFIGEKRYTQMISRLIRLK